MFSPLEKGEAVARRGALHRRVNPKIWDSADFRSLSRAKPSARELWLFLLTCEYMTSIPGVVRARRYTIAGDLEWSEADVARYLEELADKDFIEYDFDARLIWLKKAHLQPENRPANKDVVTGWRTPWGLIVDCPLKAKIYESLSDWIVTLTPACQKAFADWISCPESNPLEHRVQHRVQHRADKQEQDQEQEQDQDQDQEDSSEQTALALAPEPAVLTFPCSGRVKTWELRQNHVRELEEHFPAVDVMQQCRKAHFWAKTNPKRRKTAKNMLKWLGTVWCEPEQNKPQRRSTGPPRQRNENSVDTIARLAREAEENEEK